MFDQAAHDRQADAQAALRLAKRLPLLDEQVEDARQYFWRHADPGVAD